MTVLKHSHKLISCVVNEKKEITSDVVHHYSFQSAQFVENYASVQFVENYTLAQFDSNDSLEPFESILFGSTVLAMAFIWLRQPCKHGGTKTFFHIG